MRALRLLTPLLAFASALALPSTPAGAEHPNILMIAIDDLNDWVGVMNAHPKADTPRIDALARRGTLFTNAHAAAPLCGPTRAALLSGLRPSTTGIYGHNNLKILLDNAEIDGTSLLPEYFRDHGYTTLSTGKIFHEGSPAEAFDRVGLESRDFGPRPEKRISYIPPGGRGTSTDWGVFPETDEDMPDYQSARWAADELRRDHDRPFFLSVGFVRPHVPWYVPEKWFDRHPLETIVLPPHRDSQFDDLPETALRFSELPAFPRMDWMREERRWEKAVQAYLASVSFVDHCVGIVLDALADGPHSGNTVIVLWSDHGYHLGEKGIWAKHTLWEESTRIPLVIVRPEDREPRQTHRPVNHTDLYPTLLDLAGLPPNPRNEGQSLVPLLDNPDAPGFEASITTHAYGNHAVRTEHWRYIRYEDGAEELYDHRADPHEWTNLAGRSQYESVLNTLRTHLPSRDAPWDPATSRGSDYNDFLKELFARTRADR